MRRRSLILVTVDCLRADHVGFQGYTRPVTPFLDSLAENSIVVSNAVVAGAPTYFSFPAIMASRYPLSLGREALGIAPNEPTIATALQGAGYATAAFLAGNPYLSPRFGYDKGFDEFHDFLDSSLSGVSRMLDPQQNSALSKLNRRLEARTRRSRLTAPVYDELYFRYCQWRSARENLSLDQLRRYPAADVLINQACSWLNRLHDQPFFLWIHLMDPHHPYYPPFDALSSLGLSHISARRARFLNSFWNRGDIGLARLQKYRSQILSLYDAGVFWVDKQISRLAGALRQLDRWDEAVFVVTADHGEEFLEHGERYHSPTHLPDQLIRVPLLVRSSEVGGMAISNGSFSLIHLAPTLLGALRIDVPKTFQGTDFWEQFRAGTLSNEPAVSECVDGCNNPLEVNDRIRPRIIAVRDLDYKLVIRFGEQEDCLYDLKNDPAECSPVPPGVLTGERVRLLRVAGKHLERTTRNRNPELALRSRLRDLQYSIDLRLRKLQPA
jgi:arylsulfatase A-like enzyme